MVIKIAVCDDEENMRTTERNICVQTCSEEGLSAEINVYKSGEEYLEKGQSEDILLLDIDMPEYNGIYIKEKVSIGKPRPLIIFVTGYEQYMSEAFGMNVIAFVSKSDIHDRLSGCIKRAIEIMFAEEEQTMVEGVGSLDIEYIHKKGLYCDMYLKDGTVRLVRSTINDMEELLDGIGFVKTHKSYIVNMHYVDSVGEKGVKIGGTIIPVSVRLRTKVIYRYQEFMMKRGKYC